MLSIAPLSSAHGGKLRWQKLGPHMEEAVAKLEVARGRRLAEVLRTVHPAAPRPEPWEQVGMDLLDMHKVAPHS